MHHKNNFLAIRDKLSDAVTNGCNIAIKVLVRWNSTYRWYFHTDGRISMLLENGSSFRVDGRLVPTSWDHNDGWFGHDEDRQKFLVAERSGGKHIWK